MAAVEFLEFKSMGHAFTRRMSNIARICMCVPDEPVKMFT